MFARRTDASKIAFVYLTRQLARWGYKLIDCQVYTEHLARFGAIEIPRHEFVVRLADSLPGSDEPARVWKFDPGHGPQQVLGSYTQASASNPGRHS
jgi:leucyl/phenylalanyl-tRNA--protein transferase